MTTTATLPPPPARPVMPRTDALQQLSNVLERGLSLRKASIRSIEGLDKARELKLAWTRSAADVLNQVFGDTAAADECMNWVGRILPEYAEPDLFIQQFHEEMDHYILQLRSVLKQLQKAPAPPLRPAHNDAATQQDSPEPVAATSTITSPPPAGQSVASHARRVVSPPPPLKGLLILHGSADPAAADLRGFVESLGFVLLTIQTGGDNHAIVQSLDENRDLAFALLLVAPVNPPEGQPAPPADLASLSFELGFCVGRLGLGRVCAIHPDAPPPSTDAHGVSHLPLDPSGGWQLHLARHLKRSGLELDLNRLL